MAGEKVMEGKLTEDKMMGEKVLGRGKIDGWRISFILPSVWSSIPTGISSPSKFPPSIFSSHQNIPHQLRREKRNKKQKNKSILP